MQGNQQAQSNDRTAALATTEEDSLWAPVSPSLGASSSPVRMQDSQGINVRGSERVVSAVIGGALVARGLTSRSSVSKLLALVGSGLVYRAVSGHCHLYQALGVNTAASRS